MSEETQDKGVIGLEREFIDPDDIEKLTQESPIGAFFAFVTEEDPHSPVMLPVYDELVKEFEDQIPLYVVKLGLEEGPTPPEAFASRFLLFSAPTLLWLRQPPTGAPKIVMRMVGTVLLGKLVKEVNDRIEEILGE